MKKTKLTLAMCCLSTINIANANNDFVAIIGLTNTSNGVEEQTR